MRLVTVENIFKRARKRADMTQSGFYTDDDMFDLLNAVYTNLYDLIVGSFQNYFYKTATYTTVANQSAYTLPADFYKLILLSQVSSSTQMATIFPFNELERNSIASTDTAVQGGIQINMRYIPVAPVFTTLTETLDGYNGWDDLIVLDMAIAMLESEESSTDSLERRRATLVQRLQSSAQNRDVTLPGKVTDVVASAFAFGPDQFQYRFYGDTFELLQVVYLGV